MTPVKNDSNYIDEELQVKDLQSVLQKALECNELEVVKYTSTKLVPLGENYLSVLLKIKATIRKSKNANEEIIHIAAKTPDGPESYKWAELLRKEIFMYTELLPTFQSMKKEADMDESSFSPKLIGYRYTLDVENNDINNIDENGLLLMENLAARGFYTCNRIDGMDLQHARKAISALARFHALGAALKHKRPDFFHRSLTSLQNDCLNLQQLTPVYEMMKKNFQDDDSFAKHLSTLVSSFDRIISKKKSDALPQEPWVSITHGDFRCSNLLFHQDEHGNVDDVKFVDFQTYFYTNPLKDLPYFLCGSFSDVANVNSVNEIIDLYYDTFIATLKRLNCDVTQFTRESFDRELKEQANVEFAYIAFTVKYMLHKITDEDSNGEIRKTLITKKCSTDYVNKMFTVVEMYQKKQWF